MSGSTSSSRPVAAAEPTAIADAELYSRGAATLLASWEEYARGAPGAALKRLPAAAAGVFPDEPERGFYNNVLLQRDLAGSACGEAITAIEQVYGAAGVSRFAVWVRESDHAAREELKSRGYTLDTITYFMAIVLEPARPRRFQVPVRAASFSQHLRLAGLPPTFLSSLDGTAFQVVVAQLDGEDAATALAFEFHGDCGIYNVGTRESARRRGLATAATAALLQQAAAAGCRTASLQATPMARSLYTKLGFRELERINEYTPPVSA